MILIMKMDMNKNTKYFVFCLVAFLVLVSGCASSGTIQQTEKTDKPVKSTTTTRQEKTLKETEKAQQIPQKTESIPTAFAGRVLAGTTAPLLEFAKEDYDKALNSDKLVVLYFYANWCPICKEEIPHLEGAFNDLTTDRVIGFRVNYNDSDTDNEERNLAREFGVAYQHTKVLLKNGSRVLKSPETWSKERYLSEINKSMG